MRADGRRRREDGRSRRPVRPWARAAAAVTAVAAACLLSPPEASTQEPREPPALDAIEAAADSGRADSARRMLDRWMDARSGAASPEQRVRASFLRARLTRDADSAASRYLRVAVDGAGGYGERAWLRLAQLRLAAGEPGRALQVLDRLRSDYPGTRLTAESWLWTGHARRAAGQGREACDAWRRAVESAGDDEGTVRRRAQTVLAGCGSAGGDEVADSEDVSDDAPPDDPDDDPARTGEARPDSAVAGAPADSARRRSGWVVQLGAFRHRSGAEKLMRTVGERVPDAELAIVPPGPDEKLHRVQTFPPGDRASARRLAEELESRQISAIVVRTRP